ncbi:uncharacterized protein LOC123897686 [Trifolium pratense]|uniref:Uncharacterized protein n=2 Tax=Trifolium pratense TaxID=57577 RepID=A0ACB0KTS8_TRIPR|nr:uncharacterized protein LOC123897686 [Trifolium pratense]XP_045804377.1 uncharacterized protein LOC123897686 [Trifolium pratense]XP_045804378.1 uncharacterized protein LOC123897686 [Trifolium pratense]CAJ2660577.1 unnamed protein product [Trifolium pratense]
MMAWFGNIYQKFENMIIEVESTMVEETVQYLENQIQIVGESVRNFYSDVMEDLIPPSSCSAPVLPIAHCAGSGISNSKKSFRVSKKITAKADTKQSTKDSSINRDSGNFVKANNFISRARPHVCGVDIKSNVCSDENQQNRKMSASKTATEVALSETHTRGSSQSCEISDANQNDEATVSKTGSGEATDFASVGDCCKEIEKVSTEQNHGVPVSVEPDEEKNMSSFSSDIFEDPYGYSMVKAMQPEDCSYSTIIVSHPGIDSNVIADIDDVTTEQDHKTRRRDNASKLEETCVLINRDELPLFPNATVNIKTSEKKWLQPFSLSKKSTRKQEYEELALKHRNNENGKGDRVESLCRTLSEDVSEPEWEFLKIPR